MKPSSTPVADPDRREHRNDGDRVSASKGAEDKGLSVYIILLWNCKTVEL